MGEKELLEFYKKQLNEFRTSDDKFKEKVDTYLKELIEDRHELVAENLRRGEKISDLQTALVDLQLSCFEERERFLRVTAENEKLKVNEIKLHENIRHLLNATKDKDLRDRIIYILDDPKVEIGYQRGSSKPSVKHKQSSDEFLKDQVHQLQSKLDEHSKVSQTKTGVLLEDCKITLEKSREKLVQNEEQIRMLLKSLHDAEELLKNKNLFSTTHSSLEKNERFKETQLNTENKNTSKSLYELKSIPTVTDDISSNAAEMRFSLIFLTKIIKKSLSLLHSIQSSQVFIQAAKLSKPASSDHKYVSETDIIQLQNYVRQCTRISFDTRNALKSLKKSISSEGILDGEFSTAAELRNLESVVEELAVATAEADLITINLSRATFFEYLTAPKQSFGKFGVKEINNCAKYVADVNKMVTNLKSANAFALKAVKFVEKVQEGISSLSHENQTLSNKNKVNQGASIDQPYTSVQDPVTSSSDFVSKSRRNFYSNEKANQQDKSNNSQTINFPIKTPIDRKSYESSMETNAVIKRINKTLAKIKQIESGEYLKDNEFCQYLGEQVKALTEKVKELYNEFNVQDIQDQFSEYASVTLSKLETIAKQSRDAVISAEAQISAHRSNSKNLSQKLKDTEELLRVSINECLSLKTKLQKEKIQHATDVAQFREELQEKLEKVSDFDDLETAVKEVISSTHSFKEAQKISKANVAGRQIYSPEFDDSDTAVKQVSSRSQEFDDSETAVKGISSVAYTRGYKRGDDVKQVSSRSQEFDDPTTAVKGISSVAYTRGYKRGDDVKQVSSRSQEFDDPTTAVKGISSVAYTRGYKRGDGLKQVSSRNQEFDDPESAIKGVSSVAYTRGYKRGDGVKQVYSRSQEFDDPETAVKGVSSVAYTRESKRGDGPFECMYCKQGSEHKLCDEKIRELRANNRKLSTELKILQQEIKEEQKLSKMSQEQVTKTTRESANQSENLRSKLESLESRNASLLEQLNLERNRLKKMEKFHRFEIAGTKTDIKNLKIKIQELEKQLMKAVLIFEHDKNDLELLKSVHTTAQNSKQAVESVRRLKRKVYEMETDLKHL